MTPPAAAAAPATHRRGALAPSPARVAPRKPRRVSGPARRPSTPARAPAASARADAPGLLARVGEISRPRLDRLIRGRAWIVLIASALIGIVVLQLFVLKLNASIGRTLEREASLQRQNAALSIEGSELAAGNLVESRAAMLGMQLVPIGSVRFLKAQPRVDVKHAAAALASGARAVAGEGEAQAEAAGTTSTAAGSESSAQTATEATATEAAGPSSQATGEAAAPSSEATAQAQAPTSAESATSSSPETASEATGAGGGTRPGTTE